MAQSNPGQFDRIPLGQLGYLTPAPYPSPYMHTSCAVRGADRKRIRDELTAQVLNRDSPRPTVAVAFVSALFGLSQRSLDNAESFTVIPTLV